MTCFKLPYLFLMYLSFPAGLPMAMPSAPASCQFGECIRWHILLVPLLSDDFTQVALLKAIIRSMLSGCRWYFPHIIRIELFTKNNSFVPIKDPMVLPELDSMLDQFKFTIAERESRHPSQWRAAVEKAIHKLTDDSADVEAGGGGGGAGDDNAFDGNRDNMTDAGLTSSSSSSSSSGEEDEESGEVGRRQGRGRFIFVITNFARRQSGYGSEFQEELNKRLTESGIFFRNIRLQFDGNKQIQIIPGGGQPLIRENIRNISAKIIRVAIVEPGSDQLDAFAAIRPCPQLNDQEKIREYSYVQRFYYENWFYRNALIGFGIFLSAILCAAAAYLFSIWERTRAKRKAVAVAATEAMAVSGNISGTTTGENK